jgi:hypothetical protein
VRFFALSKPLIYNNPRLVLRLGGGRYFRTGTSRLGIGERGEDVMISEYWQNRPVAALRYVLREPASMYYYNYLPRTTFIHSVKMTST